LYRQGNLEFLEFLFTSCGADIDVTRNKRGHTLLDFLDKYRSDMSARLLHDVYQCVCTHLPYMKVNLFERKFFLAPFYSRLQTLANEACDISYVLPEGKMQELKALLPVEMNGAAHIEPDVAYLLGYSCDMIMDIGAKGADILSVVTGFPILSRYVHEGNYEAVLGLIKLSGVRCDPLFVCDKVLNLPLAYVKKEGICEDCVYNVPFLNFP
jgi:hypothetical protein